MRALGPVIPELGSVGASGDLTPMSYVAAVLSGEHEVSVAGRVCPAAEALAAAGLYIGLRMVAKAAVWWPIE